MALLPEVNKIKEALDNLPVNAEFREHMGMSGVGEKCMRKLQYDFKHAYKRKYERRIERLMNFGKIMEDVFIADLEAIGALVYDRQREVVGFAGHWKGHTDGQAIGLPGCEKTLHLLEFKTHNNKWFQVLCKLGVQEGFPKHYDQMTAYMGHCKLTRGLYLGYNKDTSEYYIERIYFNEERFKELEHKMMEVVINPILYPKIGNGKSTWHECRFCDAKDICHNDKEIERNCRTCRHVDICDDGKWDCANPKSLLYDSTLDFNTQQVGCEEYELTEELE